MKYPNDMRTNTTSTPRSLNLAELRERLSVVEHRTPSTATVPTGWPEIDEVLALGGLQRNSVHEWIGLDPLSPTPTRSRRWSPPLGLLLHLARQSAGVAIRTSTPLSICWIGRRVWPTVQSLGAHDDPKTDLLSRSLFIDAADAASRLWAADLAGRCSSVLVIADGSNFDMAATRRLQLACEAGGAGGWMTHLARPPWEVKELSAAATRWRVGREVSPADEPRFQLGLLRCKGLRSMHAQDRTFTLQRESCDRLVLVPADAGDRSHAAKVAG
jgi:hypothetical protein